MSGWFNTRMMDTLQMILDNIYVIIERLNRGEILKFHKKTFQHCTLTLWMMSMWIEVQVVVFHYYLEKGYVRNFSVNCGVIENIEQWNNSLPRYPQNEAILLKSENDVIGLYRVDRANVTSMAYLVSAPHSSQILGLIWKPLLLPYPVFRRLYFLRSVMLKKVVLTNFESKPCNTLSNWAAH